jgi:beta-galactosidase
VDRSGQRLLHLINIGPTAAGFALSYRGRPVLAGRRLRLPARTRVMLPHGVRVGAATLLETSCELAEPMTGDGVVVLRPTHGDDTDVAVFDTAPTTVDGGTVSAEGATCTVTASGPDLVRISFT